MDKKRMKAWLWCSGIFFFFACLFFSYFIKKLKYFLIGFRYPNFIITIEYGEKSGEGNGNPLQCSCLENPRDSGAWWAAIYGVAQSRTWLKRLSSSSMERNQSINFIITLFEIFLKSLLGLFTVAQLFYFLMFYNNPRTVNFDWVSKCMPLLIYTVWYYFYLFKKWICKASYCAVNSFNP